MSKLKILLLALVFLLSFLAAYFLSPRLEQPKRLDLDIYGMRVSRPLYLEFSVRNTGLEKIERVEIEGWILIDSELEGSYVTFQLSLGPIERGSSVLALVPWSELKPETLADKLARRLVDFEAIVLRATFDGQSKWFYFRRG